MDPHKRIPTPVTRNLRTLFSEPLPKGPVMLHMSEDEYKKLTKGIRISKAKIPQNAKGLFVVPDPFGNYLAFFACAAGSGEGKACVPKIVRSLQGLTFGKGCVCIRGKDPVDTTPGRTSCSFGLSPGGVSECVGECFGNGKCQPIRIVLRNGWGFLTCECS